MLLLVPCDVISDDADLDIRNGTKLGQEETAGVGDALQHVNRSEKYTNLHYCSVEDYVDKAHAALCM